MRSVFQQPVRKSCAQTREFPIHISNSRRTKCQSSAAPVFNGAGCAGHFHPLGSRGKNPLTNVRERSAERRGNIDRLAAHARAKGVHLAALHCGVFLKPQDRLLETDRGNSSPPLIPRGFLPRSSAPPAGLPRRTHLIGPGSISQGPRRWVCETHPQVPSPFHHLDASRWHPHVNEPGTWCL